MPSLSSPKASAARTASAPTTQLRAGLALAEGALVEMAPAKAKPRRAASAFCFALRDAAHIATVNAYLAERDATFAARF